MVIPIAYNLESSVAGLRKGPFWRVMGLTQAGLAGVMLLFSARKLTFGKFCNLIELPRPQKEKHDNPKPLDKLPERP